MAKISIIIPCYNSEKYIRNCLDSIINQTIGIENLEIIVVDDASTDGSVAIITEYENKYPDQILFVLNDKNRKQGAARNIGLNYATGEYISFVDSDDWVDLNKYEILYCLAKRVDADVVQHYHREMVEYGMLPLEWQGKHILYDITDVEKKRNILFDFSVYSHSCWNKMYRRDLIRKANVQFAKTGCYEEPLFTYPIKFFARRICVLEQSLHYHRYNGEGATFKYSVNLDTIYEHLNTQIELFLFMRNNPYYSIYKYEIEMYFLHAFFVEPFHFLTYRKFHMNVSIYQYMKKYVFELLPDFIKNPYLADEALRGELYILYLLIEDNNWTDTELEMRFHEIYDLIYRKLI